MGIVYHAECPLCGPSGEYCLGNGRNSLWLESCIDCLDAKEKTEIQRLMENRQIDSFTVSNELVGCDCEAEKGWQEKTIITVNTAADEEIIFGAHCPHCSKLLTRYSEAAVLEGKMIPCHRCGSNLNFSKVGHWD